MAILSLLVLGLVGCASDLSSRPSSSDRRPPYVGEFTGEFVDGKPLYRFPSIEVIGSRTSVEPDGS
jgi:hypothetical protein